jgi:hypothetical protein
LNLIQTLKELSRRRLLVALSVAFSAAVAILAVYQVSPSPPSISAREHVNAQGSIEILVDSANSPIADTRRDLTGLIARAGVFARLIAGGNVVNEIAKTTGIPAKQIDVAGPTPLAGEAPGAGEPSPEFHPYGISVIQSETLPILTVVTRAPTVTEARELAEAVPAAIGGLVNAIQVKQDTPANKQVEFRELGPAQAAPVDEALGKKVALAVFVVVLALCLLAILGLPRFRAAWRAADAEEPPPAEPLNGPQQSREVLRLATDRVDDHEALGPPPPETAAPPNHH